MDAHDIPAGVPMSDDRMQVRYGTMTRQVLGFYARLARLPLDDWSSVSHPVARVRATPAELEVAIAEPDAESLESVAAARARLRAVMDTLPGPLTRAKRRVRGIIGVAEGIVPPSAQARMQRSALIAVLALIARPHLSEEDFELLYRPFASLIPLDELQSA
jgi:hypothetical protein